MDTRIEGGDIYLTSSGEAEYLTGVREAAQRALIAAMTAKGAFIYDRSLGADYASAAGSLLSRARLEMLIREAAAGIAGADIRITDWDAENMTAVLSVTCGGDTITTEVDLHGNL